MPRTAAALLLLLLSVAPAASQQEGGEQVPPPRDLFWGTAGWGIGTGAGEDVGPGFLARLAWERGGHRIAARAAFTAEILGDGVGDYAVLYGRSHRAGRSWFSAAAGPGLVETLECPGLFSSSPCTDEHALGLALEGEAGHAFASFVGVGLTLFANLNGRRHFAGAVLALHLGRVR